MERPSALEPPPTALPISCQQLQESRLDSEEVRAYWRQFGECEEWEQFAKLITESNYSVGLFVHEMALQIDDVIAKSLVAETAYVICVALSRAVESGDLIEAKSHRDSK